MTEYVLGGVRKGGPQTAHIVRLVDRELGYYTLCGRPAKHPVWHVGRMRRDTVTCLVCTRSEARSAA